MREGQRVVASIFVACALTGALLASPARAAGVSPVDASSAQKKEATEHFLAGKQALAWRKWESAITELRASLEVIDSPNARLELARALRESGALDEAWGQFGRTAEAATRLSPKEMRYGETAEAAATERTEIEKRIALVSVTVAHAAPDATLEVAGRVVPPFDWTAPIVVPAGPVDFILRGGSGEELARRRSHARIGATTEIVLDAESAASAAPLLATAPVESDRAAVETGPLRRAPEAASGTASRATNTPWLRPLGYALGGLGVAGLTAFAVLGSMSKATYDDLTAACPRGCPPDKRDEIARGRTDQALANIGLAVGVGGIGAGVTLFLVGTRSPRASSAALLVRPGYVGLRGAL